MKAFSLEDQQAFAALSGDANPIHVDPLAARRLQFGAPVVHGVHILLRALDEVLGAEAQERTLASVQALFLRPLRLGVESRIEWRSHKEQGLRLSVRSGEEELVRITLQWAGRSWAPTSPDKVGPHRTEPAELSDFDLAGAVPVGCDGGQLARLLPNLARFLPRRQVALILATTYLVGMEAPGRHSLFTQLDLTFGEEAGAGGLAWKTRRFDDRFALLTLGLEAADAKGEVRAMVRAAPVAQARLADMAAHVGRDVFAGRRALVVGGSRGLGEIAAKLLVAGGAHVCLTYREGREEAEAVAAEIADWGGSAQVLRLDAAEPSQHDLAALASWQSSHLYYFASPFIQTGQSSRFSQDLFARFSAVYVAGLVNLASALRESLTAVFAPSSVYVTAPPAHLREYAAAKAAAEYAVQHLTQSGLACATPRLPALLTDQTAALAAGSAEESRDVLLKALLEAG